MGWKQVPKAIQVVNSTAVLIATKYFFQNKSKVMDIRFYLINDRIEHGQVRVFWRRVPENLEKYNFKHHPTEHHISVRPKYLYVPKLSLLQGCVNLTVTVSPTKRKSPAVKPTKQDSQRVQLQHYFL